MRKTLLFLIGVLILTVLFVQKCLSSMNNFIALKKCPQKTSVFKNNIIFVGKIDSLGNDKYVDGWFEYGLSSTTLKYKTKSIKINKPKLYCIKVNNLTPCTTYYYRAVAKNSAGVNYGEIKPIKTLCK